MEISIPIVITDKTKDASSSAAAATAANDAGDEDEVMASNIVLEVLHHFMNRSRACKDAGQKVNELFLNFP